MGLQELKERINKNVKGTHCDILTNSDIAEVNEWVSSPTYALNRVLSGDLFKGLPEKTLTCLVGEETTFKSSFMTNCMAQAQKNGFTGVYIDTEGAITNEFMNRWGVDTDNVLYVYEPFVDNVMAVLGQLIDSEDDKFFVCLDSVGNLEVGKLSEDAVAGNVKADQGMLQKKIKRMLKLLLALVKKKRSIAVIGAHYYASPGMFQTVDEIAGGKFIKLSPHIILSLRKSQMKDGKTKESKVIGNEIKVTSIKNRFYPAFQKCSVEIDYHNGINKVGDLASLAMEAGLLTKGGAWFTNVVTGEKVQGESQVHKIIDQYMLDELNKFVLKTGYSKVDTQMKEAMSEVSEIEKEENE